jgi:polyisoprenoid-binding protein YceI
MRRAALFSLLIGSLAPALASAQNTFQIVKKESSFSFEVSTTLGGFEGKAKAFSGSIEIPSYPSDLAAGTTATITVDAATMETGIKARDKDLNEKVIESATYPEIKIVVKKVEKDAGAYSYKITADLTMHGQTNPVTFKSAVLPLSSAGRDGIAISGDVKIDITKWGMKPPSIVVNKVSKDVVVKWSLVALKK